MIADLHNKHFQLFGEKWTIKVLDKLVDEDDGHEYFGLSQRCARNAIKIGKTLRNVEITEETLEITLLHELMHAICDSGQYFDISQNEPFIEWTAKCLHSLKKQKII